MKSIFKYLFTSGFIFSVLFLSGCAGKVSPDAVSLTVNTHWTSSSRCSTTSPEIRVEDIPPSTKQLKVTLTDLDMISYNHGGGTVTYGGSSLIPEGALKSYKGPCPPSGGHQYQIKVKAIDTSGMMVGSGKDTQSY